MNSNAGNSQFPDNRAVEFKTKLNKEIIRSQSYDVGIVSITRYVDNALPYGAPMRVKRDVSEQLLTYPEVTDLVQGSTSVVTRR